MDIGATVIKLFTIIGMISIIYLITSNLLLAGVAGAKTISSRTVNSKADTSPYKASVQTANKDFLTIYNKGVALFSVDKYNGSMAYFDKALDIDPKNFLALYYKASSLGKLGKYNDSIAYFDKALSIEPTNTLALAGKKLDLEALSETNTSQTNQNAAIPPNSAFGYYFNSTTTNATSAHRLP
jgi:tetratricopeptide (TPR) repeat protein